MFVCTDAVKYQANQPCSTSEMTETNVCRATVVPQWYRVLVLILVVVLLVGISQRRNMFNRVWYCFFYV